MTPVAPSDPALSSGVDAQNPWPGLVAFTEELQKFFHGRADETDDLVRRVERANLTVLFGQSGLGKSSLLHAGLFPRLRDDGYVPVSIRLDHAATSLPLSEQVKAGVARALVEAGGSSEAAAPRLGETLWEHFHRRSLRQQTRDGAAPRLVLVFDQFEELFAIGHASEQTRSRAAVFVAELADLIENRPPHALESRLEEQPELAREFSFGDQEYRVLVCFREDYLPHVESLRQTIPSLAENRMRLTRMDGTRALDAVLKPGGTLIAPGVGRQVVRFVAGGQVHDAVAGNGRAEDDGLARLEVEPSLLSLVCRELNNRRAALGLTQITADLLAGNRERILQDFYERSVADQPAGVREFIEDELVTDSGLRENIALERARKALAQRGAPARAIDVLVKRRLLHLEERLDVQRVELTHDVLTPVVKKSRDERQQKEATLRAEREAKEILEKARQQRKRSRLIVAGMAVVMVAVMAFGAVSFYQYRVSYERLLEVERQKDRAEKNANEARQAREEAVKEKNIAEESRHQADRHFAEARGTVDGFLTKISKEELRDIPGMQQMREQFARQALDRYERYAKSRPGDQDVAVGLAGAHVALATILGQIGKVDDTVKHFDQAIAIHDRLQREDPASSVLRLGAATARLQLAVFYWSVRDDAKSRPLLAVLIPEMEKLVEDDPGNLEARFTLAKAINSLGNLKREKNEEGAASAYERSRDLLVALLDHDFRKADVLKGVSAPLHNLALYHKNHNDEKLALDLYRLSHKYNESARALTPGAPDVESDGALTLAHMAWVMRKLGQEEEALKTYDEAIRRHRAAVRVNPNVSRYRWLLADDLCFYAQAMSAAKKYAESQKLYEESAQLLEELIEQVTDRAMYGSKLINTLEKLSSFHEGSKGENLAGSVGGGNIAEQIRYLDRAIAVGRKMSSRFPRDVDTHYQLMVVLFRRAVISDDDNTRDKASLPIYEEALETFRKGVWEVQRQPDSFETGEMLRFLQSATNCALRLMRHDKVLEFTELGYRLAKDCTRLDGVQGLCNALLRRVDTLGETGRSGEAIQACLDIVKLAEPALTKASWHWYLRNNLGGAYSSLAALYEKTGDFKNEVLAHREYLKVWTGPMHGVKIDAYVDPKNPTDETEARRLRAFRKLQPGLYTVSIPADFNGVQYPFNVHLTNVPYPKDPLEDQAKWLEEIRGGKLTEEYRERFRQIHKLAHENNVLFARFGLVAINSLKFKVPLVDLFHESRANANNRRMWYEDELAALDAALAVTPANVEYQRARAQALAELKALGPAMPPASAAGSEVVLNFAGRLTDADPLDRVLTKSHHQVQTLKMTAGVTYTIDLVSTEFDNYLRLENSAGTELAKDDDSGGNLNARIVHIPAKDDAVRIIVTSYKGGVVGAFVLTVRAAQAKGFVAPLDKQIAQLQELAKTQHDHAVACQRKGLQEDYRNALIREFDIRGEQVKLSPTNAVLKEAQAKVAAELARSCLDTQEPAGAILWIGQAGQSADIKSLFQLAEFLEKGTNIKADPHTADHYRFQGLVRRGAQAFVERRYEDALTDLKSASELPEATAAHIDLLGQCYGKLRRWDEAIRSYQRAFALEPNTIRGSGILLNLLEAFIAGERPADADPFLDSLDKKKWRPTAADITRLNQDLSLYWGFRAITLRLLKKDSVEMEKVMREHIALTNMDQSPWGWEEIDGWLKRTELAPDRKDAIETLVSELQGIARLDEKTARAGFKGNLSVSAARKVCAVRLNPGKAYQIDVNGDFDTLLRVEDSQKTQLVSNDNINSLAFKLDSRLIFAPAKDDSYRLIVGSSKTNAAGKFTLKIAEVAKTGKEELIKGELTAKDEKYSGGFAHRHKIQLEAGRPYTIELDSATYDTRLILFDPSGAKIAGKNEGIAPNNYRLSRIDFTPQTTAVHVILTTSYDPGKTGPYTLRVQGYGPKSTKE